MNVLQQIGHTMKSILYATFFVYVMLAAAPPPASQVLAAEQIPPAINAQRRIYLASRQRMLIQLMANSTCHSALDIRGPYHVKQMALARWLFERTMRDLRNGSDLRRVLPEVNAAVLESLNKVDAVWTAYSKIVTQWQSGAARDFLTLQNIYTFNTLILRHMQTAVNLIKAHYGHIARRAPSLSRALNEADRLRLLWLKASKEYCLIASGHQPQVNRDRLKITVAQFNASLLGLMKGDESRGISGAPASMISEQLERVQKIWAPFETSFLRMTDQTVSPAELFGLIETINQAIEIMLEELNRVVELYEVLNERSDLE